MPASTLASGGGGEAVVGGDVGAPLVVAAAVVVGAAVVEGPTTVDGAADVVDSASVEPVSESVVVVAGELVVGASVVDPAVDGGAASWPPLLHAASAHAATAAIATRNR